MPITRTPLIDDDGSGTTGTILNNAWPTGLYNQIDAAIASGPIYGTWTPVDGSGAGLVMQTGTAGQWSKYGRVVVFWCQVIYPSNVNGTPARIGGLPYVIRQNGAAAQGAGPSMQWYLQAGLTAVQAISNAGMAHVNWDLSGANIIISGTYLTD
jgi:hypothetical protein